VSLLSAKDQNIKVTAPSDIKDISIEDGNCQIEETGDKHDRMISLPEDEIVTLRIDIQ